MVKRHGNLFENIVEPNNLYEAYRKARRGKGWQDVVKRFEENLDENLAELRRLLVEKEFRTSEYRSKVIHEPKRRRIYILPFNPDRIVQHALMQVVAPIWDKLFIYHSYACREGKGMHRASRVTMEYLRKNEYVLKADMAKFYPSIVHDIMYAIVKKKIKCPDTLWLLRDIIYSFRGGKNVPIGNYTSQWFGNLYLNEMDQWLKHELKIRYYIRYCDDFVLFHNDKGFLHEVKNKVEKFIAERLALKFSRWSVFPVTQGIDFLGYRHFPGYILLRKSTAKRVKRRLKRLPKQLARGEITMEQYRSSIASTEGWLQWANTYNLSLALEIEKLKEVYETV